MSDRKTREKKATHKGFYISETLLTTESRLDRIQFFSQRVIESPDSDRTVNRNMRNDRRCAMEPEMIYHETFETQLSGAAVWRDDEHSFRFSHLFIHVVELLFILIHFNSVFFFLNFSAAILYLGCDGLQSSDFGRSSLSL